MACSLCTSPKWVNQTRITCQLPSTSPPPASKPITNCESKVSNAILTQLSQNRLKLVHFFLGNLPIPTSFTEYSDNLKIYLQSFTANNVDNFSEVGASLALHATNGHLLTEFLRQHEASSLVESAPRSLIMVAGAIAALLVLLLIFSAILVSIVLKTRRSCKQLDHLNFGKSRRSKKELARLVTHLEQLESSVRAQCTQQLQQLHAEYFKEFANDIIYSHGLPLWNHRTYLLNTLFPSLNVEMSLVLTRAPNMTNSSMSNSTTNTLLTSCKQVPTTLNSTMSVYATIKSSHLLAEVECKSTPQGEAMFLFEQLIHNKTFLLSLASFADNLPVKDKFHLASLITLALKDNLPYLYSVIKTLISEYISAGFKANSTGLLFRSNDSLVEFLLSNWITMFMYDFHKDTQCGAHFYRLVKVIKFYLEMGPCDQANQLAAHSLNEERLLKETVPSQALYLSVVNQSSTGQVHVCRVLDCDTIHQAKEKIIDALFKANPAKPSPKEVDLDLCVLLITPNSNEQVNPTTVITLKETEDELTNNNNNNDQMMKRLLTLKDYNIKNGALVNLSIKSNAQHVYMSTLSMSNEYSTYAAPLSRPQVPNLPPPLLPNRYHLVKPNSQLVFSTNESSSSSSSSSPASSSASTSSSVDSQSSASNSTVLRKKPAKKKKKKYEKLLSIKTTSECTSSLLAIDSTNSLIRLLINKGTLQPFIDKFFESVFANSSNLPPIIQHLFELFNSEAQRHYFHKDPIQNRNEIDRLTKTWMTNTYFLRYWINIIKNPEFLFDLNKNWLMDSSLSCVAQAFVDSLTENWTSVDSRSPLNRILFLRDIPRYKQMTDAFYIDLQQSTQPIADHQLHFYLNEFSKSRCQQNQQIGATLNQQLPFGYTTELSSMQVLLQLYEFYERGESQINSHLNQQQHSAILLPVHHRQVQIKDLMMRGTNSNVNATLNRTNQYLQHFNLNTNLSNHVQQQSTALSSASSANPYEQPLNCYAATNVMNHNSFSNQQFSNFYPINSNNFSNFT